MERLTLAYTHQGANQSNLPGAGGPPGDGKDKKDAKVKSRPPLSLRL
jgi:hypothetical protein